MDAINMNNERYSIKAVTTKITGVFNGLNEEGSTLPQERLFEYIIIVELRKDLSTKAIFELDWEDFLLFKRWNKSKKTWYLAVTNELKRKAKVLCDVKSSLTV